MMFHISNEPCFFIFLFFLFLLLLQLSLHRLTLKLLLRLGLKLLRLLLANLAGGFDALICGAAIVVNIVMAVIPAYKS